jgi:hypothetical protein
LPPLSTDEALRHGEGFLRREPLDGRLLGFQAKAAAALPFCAESENFSLLGQTAGCAGALLS